MTLSQYSERPPNMVGVHGNAIDRALGVYWEERFIDICRLFGWEAWPYAQKKGPAFVDERTGTRYISPDVWVLRRGFTQYACEVKHKAPTRYGCFGLEKYRASSLVGLATDYRNQFGGVTSLYVIHNHALSGGRESKTNVIHHWAAQDIVRLQAAVTVTAEGPTYRNSVVTTEPIHYYSTASFTPLFGFLGATETRTTDGGKG